MRYQPADQAEIVKARQIVQGSIVEARRKLAHSGAIERPQRCLDIELVDEELGGAARSAFSPA